MPVSYKQIIEVLHDFGYKKSRQSGSHEIRNLSSGAMVVVPKHKELKPGTAKNILGDVGLQNDTDINTLKKDYSLKL